MTEASSRVSASATKTAASVKVGVRYLIRIVRCPKRSTRVLSETLAKPYTRLERRTEDVPRWLRWPLHEAWIRVDRGIVGCGEHTEISSMIQGLWKLCVAALRSSLNTTWRTFM